MSKYKSIKKLNPNFLAVLTIGIFVFVGLFVTLKYKQVNNAKDQDVLAQAADSIPPVAPTNLKVYSNLATARSGGSRDDLSWAPASDNVGVASYLVYQVVGGVYDKNPLAEVAGTSYSRQFKVDGYATDYTYYVVAKDTSGNVSERSNLVHMTGVWGDILDASNNRYIRGAKVDVAGTNGFKTSMYANYAGAYLLNLTSGSYTLIYSAPNYVTQTYTISVVDNKMSPRTVFLQKIANK